MSTEKLKAEYFKRGYSLYYNRSGGWSLTTVKYSPNTLRRNKKAFEDIEDTIKMFLSMHKEDMIDLYKVIAKTPLLEQVLSLIDEGLSTGEIRKKINEPEDWKGTYGYHIIDSVVYCKNNSLIELIA